MSGLPSDAAERCEFPIAEGCLFYFPAALAWVSRCSLVGNRQHNGNEPMHWAMDKSTDHANKILRHLLDVGTDDSDGIPHSVKVAWRALALAQEDLMARKGATMPRNARREENMATVTTTAEVIPAHVDAATDQDVAAYAAPNTPATVPVAD